MPHGSTSLVPFCLASGVALPSSTIRTILDIQLPGIVVMMVGLGLHSIWISPGSSNLKAA